MVPDGKDEVMVHIHEDNDISDVYCYNDSPLLESHPELGWAVGANLLFLHAADPEVAFRVLEDEGYFFPPEDE